MSKQDVAKELNKVLADTFVLYFKTHSFHWNVTGARFHSLHVLFEEQYTNMWESMDVLAERIRALGEFAADNPNDLMKNASLSHVGQTPDSEEMIEMLANDNREIVKTLKNGIDVASKNDDDATEDMLIERIQIHEQFAWMLESSKAA
ncbi:MAG: DNA starvation/stationary phase protection protein [Alphaproteobacteria bacterium]|nr:DNA starvation/stationary phase protection protein [Alphaproteobacteria bacterium]